MVPPGGKDPAARADCPHLLMVIRYAKQNLKDAKELGVDDVCFQKKRGLRGSRSAPLKLKEISQELSQCRSCHSDHHVFVAEHGAVPSNRTECVFSRLPKDYLSHPSATRRLLRKQ